MEQEKLVQGWMVCGTEEDAQKPEVYFLDVNNAIAYREMHRDAASLTIRLQYILPEWAKTFTKAACGSGTENRNDEWGMQNENTDF